MSDQPGLTGASPLSAGDVLAGRYQVINELGRGGYAIVYEARDLYEDRIVALKTLRPIAPRPQEVVARFKREVELVSRLRHPNTVRVYDYGVEGDLYLAMELLRGVTLAEELDSHRKLPIRRSLAIAHGVLGSLSEAHGEEIVHRDLKPENIFLIHDSNGEEQVKVLDFGIAKLTRYEQERSRTPSLTMRGRAMGTPTYMSPEQARGAPLTVQSDVYAVGVLLYEMISGYAPYRGDNAMDIMLKHVNENLPPLGDPRLRGTPIDLAIRKALAKKPEDRFDDCRAFLSAIGGTVAFKVPTTDSHPTAAKQPPPPPGVASDTSRTPSGGRIVTRSKERRFKND